MTACKTITCSYRVAAETTSRGARASLVGGWSDGARERIRVLCRSRSGRWIETWEHHRRLADFRLTTIVPESADHGRISRVSLFGPDTRWALARMRALCDHLNAGGWGTSPHNPARTPVE